MTIGQKRAVCYPIHPDPLHGIFAYFHLKRDAFGADVVGFSSDDIFDLNYQLALQPYFAFPCGKVEYIKSKVSGLYKQICSHNI